jgi:hypothetical protein
VPRWPVPPEVGGVRFLASSAPSGPLPAINARYVASRCTSESEQVPLSQESQPTSASHDVLRRRSPSACRSDTPEWRLDGRARRLAWDLREPASSSASSASRRSSSRRGGNRRACWDCAAPVAVHVRMSRRNAGNRRAVQGRTLLAPAGVGRLMAADNVAEPATWSWSYVRLGLLCRA